MADGGDSWSVGDWHIPTVVAVSLWSAAALIVLGLTGEAFVRTADGQPDWLTATPPGQAPVSPGYGNERLAPGTTGPVGAYGQGGQLAPGTTGPVGVGRGKFTPSPDAPFPR